MQGRRARTGLAESPLAPLAAAALLAAAAPAAAQTDDETPPPGAGEAAAVIGRAGAEAVFEDVTRGEVPTIRHRGSGVHCVFSPGSPANDLRVDPQAPPDAASFVCTTAMLGPGVAVASLVGRKREDSPDLDAAADEEMRFLKETIPDLRPYEGPLSPLGPFSNWPARIERRLSGSEERTSFIRMSVAVVGDWTVAHRIVARADMATEADGSAEVNFGLALDDMLAVLAGQPSGWESAR